MFDWLLQFRIDNAVKSLGKVAKALSKRGEKLVEKKAEERRAILESKERLEGYGEQIKVNESLVNTFETIAKTLESEIK